MSEQGVVFDIKELAVYDGPGIRTTVFMKGCPMRCAWCHNPEGLSYTPQLMVSPNGCLHCGACVRVCEHRDHCVACGRCVRACPRRLRRIAGTVYSAEELAQRLLKDKDILAMNGGGITFSGGEPTAQAAFVIDVLERTREMNRAIETCGFCRPDVFRDVLQNVDFVQMDVKIVDRQEHIRWTKCDNAVILENLDQVKASGKPYIIRVPLIPGVNDTQENLSAVAALLDERRNLQRVELLPYHKTAGAKYSMVDLEYHPGFDTERKVNADTTPFVQAGIPVKVL